MCDYKTLKLKFLQAKEICAKKIQTTELFIRGVKINPPQETTTDRCALKSIPVPPQLVMADDLIFRGIYALPAMQISPSVVRSYLQTFSYQFAIDNVPPRLQIIDIVTTLGYPQITSTEAQIILYNPTTRTWDPFRGDLTSYTLNKLTYKNPPDQILNITNTLSLIPNEICDLAAKQQELMPGGLGPQTLVVIIIWVNATFIQDPFEPTIETQYSATYKSNITCV